MSWRSPIPAARIGLGKISVTRKIFRGKTPPTAQVSETPTECARAFKLEREAVAINRYAKYGLRRLAKGVRKKSKGRVAQPFPAAQHKK
jgi:hypothetical protein